MSNSQADRLAEQIKRTLTGIPRAAELKDALNAVDALAALAKQQASPDAQASTTFTPELVEDRLNSWRQRLMNRSGDRLALDDFMGQESIDDLIDFVCDGATPPSAPQCEQAGAGAYHAWCGDIEDEAILRRASSVMQDVLTDISEWEDKALAEAVTEAKRDIDAMVERAALSQGTTPDAGVGGKYADVLTPFVAAMEAELHANSAKGDRPGWLTMSREVALLEIYWHAAKLSAAVKNNEAALIREHSADVANMAMMLLDVCGGLDVRAATPSAPQAAGAVPLEWKKAVQEAYGWLWHVNNEPTAPVPMWAPEKAAYEARKNLRDLLTKEERGEAINAVGGMLENKARAIAQSTPPAMSDERIESMLSDLDQYAREVDICDYGLPSICDHPRLVEIVREFLAEPALSQGTTPAAGVGEQATVKRDFYWPAKRCPCGDVQSLECQDLLCEWERDPSLVPMHWRSVVPCKSHSLEPRAAAAAPKPAQAEPMSDALWKALERMDRARGWLTGGAPYAACNWAVLDTSDLRAILAEAGIKEKT